MSPICKRDVQYKVHAMNLIKKTIASEIYHDEDYDT